MSVFTLSRRLSSTKYLLLSNKSNLGVIYNQRCNLSSEIPSFIVPIFNYASNSLITQSIQTGIDGKLRLIFNFYYFSNSIYWFSSSNSVCHYGSNHSFINSTSAFLFRKSFC